MSTNKKAATVHPVDDQVLIRRAEMKSETVVEGTEQQAPRVFRGVIAAIGPGMPTMTGARMAPEVATSVGTLVKVASGDGVIYPAENAQELTIESGKFDVIRFRDIIAVLKQE